MVGCELTSTLTGAAVMGKLVGLGLGWDVVGLGVVG